MAYLNGLLGAIKEPSGFWINIIKSFEGRIGNYVLAVILLTVIIRLIWGIVDTFQKWSSQRQASVQAKMQPELDAVAKKYAKQPQLLQQKQNEVQRKYYGKGMYGSCVIMLIIMALNLLIFFTLFSSLNTMASYKSASSYDSIKYSYINSLNVTDDFLENNTSFTSDEKIEILKDYKNISYEIETRDGAEEGTTEKWIVMKYNNETIEDILYSTDFSTTQDKIDEETGDPVIDEETGDPVQEVVLSNTNVIKLIQKYFPVDEEGKYDASQDVILEQSEEIVLYRSQAIQNAIMEEVVDVYDQTKDSFLWIKNVWIADAPYSDSIVSYNTLVSQIGSKNIEDGEKTIYDAFMPDLKEARNRTNGYFIIPILCVVTAFLSTELNNMYNKAKSKKKGLPMPKKQGIVARLVMPMVLGLFALLYNSVFAIYMLVGQLVSMILAVPQLIIVDKIIEKIDKKKEEKTKPVVDYSRKF